MKIRNQLFVIFLILGVTVTLIVSILIYVQGKKIILNQFYANLEAVSQAKKTRLEVIIQNKYETLELVANTPLLVKELTQYNLQSGKKNHTGIDSTLKHFNSIMRTYNKFYITDIHGDVIGSSDPKLLNKNFSGEESFTSTLKDGKYLNGFFYNRKNELSLTGGTLIYSRENRKILGVLFAVMEADDILTVTSDYTGLGKTGESVLARAYDHIIFLTPTRFNPNAALNIRLPIMDTSYAMSKALSGKEGLLTDVLDYRQKEVIASARFLEKTEWGILTKIDQEEAFANIYTLRNFLIMFNASFIILSFILAYFTGGYLAKPLEELIHTTNKIREGDLGTRVNKYPANELGTLAESFNGMADKLEKKINELDKVAYVISHDLRAPLNSIIPLINYIQEDNQGKLNKETEKMLGMIQEKAYQMNELITEILKTARTEKKTKENIDVNSMVNTIVNNLRPPAHIEIFIQHNLPSVYCHKVSLMQVFQNLIDNAIKYMDKKPGKVKIGFTDEGNEYRFCVNDNGAGIKEENLQRVFGMFESANTQKDVSSTGIGLAVAKKAVEENGGSIWVESEYGQGSSFYFTVPKS